MCAFIHQHLQKGIFLNSAEIQENHILNNMKNYIEVNSLLVLKHI